MSLDSMYKKLNDFKIWFNKFNTLNSQTDENKNLEENVLDDVGNLLKELHYIYKVKYNEEEYGLNSRDKKF